MKFGLDFIKKLKPCKYNFKAPLNDGRTHFGFIAQEVDKIVSRTEYNFVDSKKLFRNDNGEYLAINYFEFIAPLVKAVQELDKKITALEKKTTKIVKK